MEGKILVTILGLLLAQVLGALLIGAAGASFAVEAVVAIVFIASAAAFLARSSKNRPYATAPAVFAFGFGFLNIVYLSFASISLWVVLLLCLDAAGFILALDQLEGKRRPLPKPPIYQPGDMAVRKKPAKRQAAKKTSPKKASKKTTKKSSKKSPGRPRKTMTKKSAAKKTSSKTAKKRGPGRPRKKASAKKPSSKKA